MRDQIAALVDSINCPAEMKDGLKRLGDALIEANTLGLNPLQTLQYMLCKEGVDLAALYHAINEFTDLSQGLGVKYIDGRKYRFVGYYQKKEASLLTLASRGFEPYVTVTPAESFNGREVPKGYSHMLWIHGCQDLSQFWHTYDAMRELA